MSIKSLSQRIWDGDYGWGGDGVLAQARCIYLAGRHSIASSEYLITYASTLYSVISGCFARSIWYWPQGCIAFVHLYRLLRYELPHFFELGTHTLRYGWTCDQCETVATILLKFRQYLLSHKRRHDFTVFARELLWRGVNESRKEMGSHHTRSFLYIRLAELQFEKVKQMRQSGEIKGVGIVIQDADSLLTKAAFHADNATDNNQKSRCYRGLAEVFHKAGNQSQAEFYLNMADLIAGISQSVVEKNAAARRRMKL